jgi:hypothetical protein
MDPVTSTLFVVIVTFTLMVVIFGVVGVFTRRLRAQNLAAAQAKFPHAQLIVPDAMFFGQQSKGATQLRGTGTLVLTDKELYFRKWAVGDELTIPFSSIESIETPKGHLGKTYGRPLLKVNYRREDGQADSVAWFVGDLPQVKGQLETLSGSRYPTT